MLSIFRRLLFGRPLPTWRQKHERLPKILALPVFASDALSSNAYATEEILLAFAIAGAGAVAWKLSIPIAIAIATLLAIVVVSYRLTIFAYPQGGGSYIVTKENLGIVPGLVAAAALLTDYVMTVAVSIASGVAAVTSAYPPWAEHKVLLGILFVAVVALANLRGLRESGTLFAALTYPFVICMFTMIVVGLYRVLSGQEITPVNPVFQEHVQPISGIFMWFVILKAFTGGCAAMTGTEAVADGIQAFRPPESKNAAATLVWMAVILAFLFIGITVLAAAYQAAPHLEGGHGGAAETIVSQIARGIFGRSWFYYAIQATTAAILVLAANTAYQDFPRLSSILARDRFAPRQFANIGDRLVFNNGILALSLFAASLIVIFDANVHRMIPLYAVGVFMSFTLSQFSMSLRQRRLKQQHWKIYTAINTFGAVVTGIVAVVIAVAKFTHGAYIILTIIPVLVYVFKKINQHYMELAEQLRVVDGRFEIPPPVKSTAIVLVGMIHKGVLPALEYARTLSHDCRALYIEVDPNDTPIMRERWEMFGLGVPLVILESPYRSVINPVLKYLEQAKKERPDHIITVVLPEFVPKKWWHKFLHNQSGIFLKIALMLQKDVVFTNVRYYLEK